MCSERDLVFGNLQLLWFTEGKKNPVPGRSHAQFFVDLPGVIPPPFCSVAHSMRVEPFRPDVAAPIAVPAPLCTSSPLPIAGPLLWQTWAPARQVAIRHRRRRLGRLMPRRREVEAAFRQGDRRRAPVLAAAPRTRRQGRPRARTRICKKGSAATPPPRTTGS